MPGERWRSHHRGGPVECRLVAESTEFEDTAPALIFVRSHGQGIRLRGRIQEARSECGGQGPACVDDGLAGVVARGLRTLWWAFYSDGVAQRWHLPHRRRAGRGGLWATAFCAAQ